MMNLALWLKRNGFKADQVQTFYPSPMATATAMYHSGRNPLKGISRVEGKGERVDIVKGEKRRRLHKAFLRYHDPNNWPLLREALKAMGRADLIGNGQHHLIPFYQPMTDGGYESARRKNSTATGTRTSVVTVGRAGRAPSKRVLDAAESPDPRGIGQTTRPPHKAGGGAGKTPQRGQILTQHTGLPPRDNGSRPARPGSKPGGMGRKKPR
jgi:hypothetical protein